MCKGNVFVGVVPAQFTDGALRWATSKGNALRLLPHVPHPGRDVDSHGGLRSPRRMLTAPAVGTPLEEVKNAIRNERLIHGTLIAAAQRNVELSRNIIAKILSSFIDPISEDDCRTIFHGLLMAGAAFEDEDQWAEWLSEQLAQLAIRMQRGAAQAFLSHLEALKVALPLPLRIHARAEALARAALF